MAEVWGTEATWELCRDKLKALLDALVTAMATGYDPALEYAYDNHMVAKLQVNAATIEITDLQSSYLGIGTPGVSSQQNVVPFQIRVHTAYENGRMDTVKNMRLLNSIANYINTHRDLSDGYRVGLMGNMNPQQTFDDSLTLGGSLEVQIIYYIQHTQL